MLHTVQITVIVTDGWANLAVRMVCAEKPAFIAPIIPIVAQAKYAVMAATACRLVLRLRRL